MMPYFPNVSLFIIHYTYLLFSGTRRLACILFAYVVVIIVVVVIVVVVVIIIVVVILFYYYYL